MAPKRKGPCPCGSGQKYKHCCEGETDSMATSKLSAGLLIALLLVGAFLAAQALMQDHEGVAAGQPGKVWSPEHGHWH